MRSNRAEKAAVFSVFDFPFFGSEYPRLLHIETLPLSTQELPKTGCHLAALFNSN